jgi:phosphoribosyl-ATP pyrophosphohydrolase
MKKSSTPNQRKKIALRTRELCSGEENRPQARNGTNISANQRNARNHGLGLVPAECLTARAAVLDELRSALNSVTANNHPRTFKLLQCGRRKLARKLIEEACEVTVEAVKHEVDGVVRESADLLYHLVVLWFHIGVEPAEVWQEMQSRADALGIAEKRPKPTAFSIDLDC